jgi:hypothetical protein
MARPRTKHILIRHKKEEKWSCFHDGGYTYKTAREFLFSMASKTDLQPPNPYTKGTGAVWQKIQRQGREADQSPSVAAGIKNTWNDISTPP